MPPGSSLFEVISPETFKLLTEMVSWFVVAEPVEVTPLPIFNEPQFKVPDPEIVAAVLAVAVLFRVSAPDKESVMPVFTVKV